MRQTRNNIIVRLALLFVLMTVSLSASAGDVQLRKGGSIVGKIESRGDVRIGGSIVGRFEQNGDIRVKGSIEGRIESNGDIRKNGSIIGRAEGMTDKRQVAVMYFFGFFNM